MLNPRPVALCLTLALAITSPPPLGAAAPRPYHIAGSRKDAAGKWRAADVLGETQREVSFQIQYLTPAAARRALSTALGRDLDLLPGRVDERQPGFLVFVLQVSNGASQDVVFNPTQARLSTEKGDMEFAMDYSALYEVAMRLGPAAPSLEELGTALFDRGVTIRPGGSVRKLLAFEAPREDRYKSFEVRLAEVNVGPLSLDAVFPFRQFFDE